jgi:L-lysine exporter family protein LysE/ArgO|tara:strand:+ start:398 stop:1039 length:642 start_codon:yes stop_codon:yes gene_type:complete
VLSIYPPYLIAALEGFALGGGLIIAIGAQNAYLIRQGVRGEGVFFIATLCFLSDALLIAIGSAGVGSLIASDPLLRSIAAWGGALFLSVYVVKSALAVFNSEPMQWDVNAANPHGVWKIALTTLAMTFLNPHVYLDTLVLVGGIAAQYELTLRTYFTVGAIFASCIWFYGLAIFSVNVAPFFQTKGGARLLDGTVCAVMLLIAVSLIKGELEN